MDVFDLQGRISIDTTPYIDALRRAAAETERLRTSMSTPITTPLGVSSPGRTPGSGTGATPGSGSSALPSVTTDAQAAGKAIDELNGKLSEGFAKAVKVAAAAWGTFSAAAIAATKKAVESYAQYEQLVGGVDTIFKESSQKVQQYAENAYKTAGMSANQYMETVTGFSMSLLQGLQGDTEKAAEMADLAIRDMSDNANKMGSNISSIQTAYLAFSRQQFQLLDNLRLGYGGTKAEMERLLKDAEKLSGIKFNISNYSDIIQAIHIIQEDLDITGTTAKEAADTIEGSFNSTKAALDNLLVGFARSDADIDKLMGDVENNVRNLAKNVIPVAERAFVTMSKTAISAAIEISKEMPRLIGKAAEDTHKMIAQSFGDSADKIYAIEAAVKAATAAFIAYKATAYLADVVDSIKKVNDAMKAGVTLTEAMSKASLANPYVLIATAAVAAATAIKSVIDTQTDLIEEAVNGYDLLSESQQKMVDEVNELARAAGESRKNWESSTDSIQSNAAMCKALSEQLYELNSQEKLSNEDKAKMKAIVDQLNGSIDGLNIELDEATGHLKTQKSTIDELIDSYQKQAKAAAAQEYLTELYKEQYQAEKNLKKATSDRSEVLRRYNELQAKVINKQKERAKLQEQLDNTPDVGGKITDQLAAVDAELLQLNADLDLAAQNVGDVNGAFVSAKETFRQNTASIYEVSTALANMNLTQDEAMQMLSDTAGVTGQIIANVNAMISQINNSTEGFWLNIKDNTRVVSVETAEEIGKLIDTYDSLYDAQYKAIEKSVDLYKGFEADTSTTYNDLYNNLKQSEFYLNDWTTAIDQLQEKVDRGLMSQEFLDSLKDMGLDSWNIVYNMNQATEGQLKDYSDLWVKTNREIKESTDKLTEDQREATESRLSELTGYADASIEDYKKAFTDLGVSVGQGLEKGIQDSVKMAKAELEKSGEELIRIGYEIIDEFNSKISRETNPVLKASQVIAGSAINSMERLAPAINAVQTTTKVGTQSTSQPYTFNLLVPDGSMVGRWIAPYVDAEQGRTATFTAGGYAR